MARMRRTLAPINTNKHFIARTKAVIAGGAIHAANLVIAVARDAVDAVNEVEEGAVVKAVHCQYWVSGTGAAGTNAEIVTVLEKIPTNQASVTFSQILNLQAYTNKKNILHTFQGLVNRGADGANPISPLNGWVLIPKGKQRFGLGDSLVYSVATVEQSADLCGMTIYKEYL